MTTLRTRLLDSGTVSFEARAPITVAISNEVRGA